MKLRDGLFNIVTIAMLVQASLIMVGKDLVGSNNLEIALVATSIIVALLELWTLTDPERRWHWWGVQHWNRFVSDLIRFFAWAADKAEFFPDLFYRAERGVRKWFQKDEHYWRSKGRIE